MSVQVVVLGMHRSGTSLVAQLLREVGFYLGESEDLLPPDEHNPAGYQERGDLVDAHKRLLKSAGTDWTSVHALDLACIPAPALTKYRLHACSVMDALAQHGRSAIKSPTLCVLLPVWQKYLTRPYFLICVRHPLEVAMSLNVRDDLPISVGCALWELYTRAALVHTRAQPRLLVFHEALMMRPDEEIARLLEGLRSHDPCCAADATARVLSGVVRGCMYRQRYDDLEDDVGGAVTPEQQTLYESLRNGNTPDLTTILPQRQQTLTLLEQFALSRRLTRKLKLQRKQAETESETLRNLNSYIERLQLASDQTRDATALESKINQQVDEQLRETQTKLSMLTDQVAGLADVNHGLREELSRLAVGYEEGLQRAVAADGQISDLRQQLARAQRENQRRSSLVDDFERRWKQLRELEVMLHTLDRYIDHPLRRMLPSLGNVRRSVATMRRLLSDAADALHGRTDDQT